MSRQAVRLDRNDARVLAFAGHALKTVARRFDEAGALLDEAVRIDPNLAIGWSWRGSYKNSMGLHDEAIKDLEQAIRLSPRDVYMFLAHAQMAASHLLCGRYDEAVKWSAGSLRLLSTHLWGLRVLVASLAMTGRMVAPSGMEGSSALFFCLSFLAAIPQIVSGFCLRDGTFQALAD